MLELARFGSSTNAAAACPSREQPAPQSGHIETTKSRRPIRRSPRTSRNVQPVLSVARANLNGSLKGRKGRRREWPTMSAQQARISTIDIPPVTRHD